MSDATRSSRPSGDVEQLREGGLLQSAGRIPWWVAVVAVLGALLTIGGAVIGKVAPTLLTNGTALSNGARVYADYFFARNVPLALLLLALLVLGARRMLAGFMVLTALIQVVDVVNDLLRGDLILVPGLLVFAIVFLVGASRLFGQAVWSIDAWRDPISRAPKA